MPTALAFLPGNLLDRGAWQAAAHRGLREPGTTWRLSTQQCIFVSPLSHFGSVLPEALEISWLTLQSCLSQGMGAWASNSIGKIYLIWNSQVSCVCRQKSKFWQWEGNLLADLGVGCWDRNLTGRVLETAETSKGMCQRTDSLCCCCPLVPKACPSPQTVTLQAPPTVPDPHVQKGSTCPEEEERRQAGVRGVLISYQSFNINNMEEELCIKTLFINKKMHHWNNISIKNEYETVLQ